jgi:aminopeptidase
VTESDLETLARLLIGYSLRIEPGDIVRIRGGKEGLPLMSQAYRLAVDMGAYPFIDLTFPDLELARLNQAPLSALDFVSPIERSKTEHIDGDLWVISDADADYSSVPASRLARWRQAQGVLAQRWAARTGVSENRLRWCAVLYPSATLAKAAGKTDAEFQETVRHALFLDAPNPEQAWRERATFQRKLCEKLVECDSLRVVARNTDITFRTGGRGWLNGNGQLNLPDGEICTSPVEDSANGTVQFTYPVHWQGREIHEVQLTFEQGRVVSCHSQKGLRDLEELLETDEGASHLGEFAIATNEAVTEFSHCILLDEKMDGTCHFALGRSIPGTGGSNMSALHLDMVLDLHEGGRIYADARLIYENGQFVADFVETGDRKPFWKPWSKRSRNGH